MASGKKRNELLLGLTITAASVAVTLLLAELVLFRLVLPGSDRLVYDFSQNGVVKYVPNQTGVYRVKNEIAAPFHINQDGWNSGHESYRTEKGGRLRIAVIGDSYVEALQVPYDSSLAEQMEELCGGECEVYRFGISGAPLSQYWHVLRQEVASYNSDWVVVIMVQNDFDESFIYREPVRRSAFLKLKMEGDRVIGEEYPSPPFVPWYEPLQRLGIYRSLWIRFQLRAALVRSTGLNDPNNVPEIGGQLGAMRGAAQYAIERMRGLAAERGFRLLLVMDGDRMAIYREQEGEAASANKGVRSLHDMVREVAREADVELLDLHDLFEEDYRRNHHLFNFANDYHWNGYTHAFVAQEVYRRIEALLGTQQPERTSPPTTGSQFPGALPD